MKNISQPVKTINIHGNDYIPVDERVRLAHADTLKSITTELISTDPVLVKATVVTDKGTFTGHSAANPTKTIEKISPYEVAETSAVGRALGFAGFGLVGSIATADEMLKATGANSKGWGGSVEANKTSASHDSATPDLSANKPVATCYNDGKWVMQKNLDYAKQHYGITIPMCYTCQQKPERRETALKMQEQDNQAIGVDQTTYGQQDL